MVQRANRDLFYFNHVVRGYTRSGVPYMNDEGQVFYGCMMREYVHRDACDFVEERLIPGANSPIVLMPRGSFKSDVISIGLAMREMGKNPNISILLYGETEPKVQERMEQLMWELEHNALYHQLYGNHSPPINKPKSHRQKWGQKGITSALRTSKDPRFVSKQKKEATVTPGAVGVDVTGKHYDLIIVDDPISDKNQETDTLREKVNNDLNLLFALLNPGGNLVAVGTRWRYNDQWKRWANTGKFDMFERSAESNPGQNRKYFFPEVLGPKYLERRRDVLGSYLYAAQYLNQPRAEGDAEFKDEWVKHYDLERAVQHEKFNKAIFFTTVDPAGQERKNTDFAVVLTHACTPGKKIFLVDGAKDKMDTPTLVREIQRQARKWKSVKVGIEQAGMQETIRDWIKDRREEDNFHTPVVPVSHEKKPKPYRIRWLIPHYEAGRIYLPEKLPYRMKNGRDVDIVQELLGEYFEFPMGDGWHILDAQAYLTKIMYFPEEFEPDPIEKELEEMEPNQQRQWKRIWRHRGIRRTGPYSAEMQELEEEEEQYKLEQEEPDFMSEFPDESPDYEDAFMYEEEFV